MRLALAALSERHARPVPVLGQEYHTDPLKDRPDGRDGGGPQLLASLQASNQGKPNILICHLLVCGMREWG